jgi:Rad3-related DNA helicase
MFDEENGGALLMGVCRGRILERLNFSDNTARQSIVDTNPYPQIRDDRVGFKKDYLDHKMKNLNLPTTKKAYLL